MDYLKKPLERGGLNDSQITVRIPQEMRDRLNELNINASEMFRQTAYKEIRKRESE